MDNAIKVILKMKKKIHRIIVSRCDYFYTDSQRIKFEDEIFKLFQEYYLLLSNSIFSEYIDKRIDKKKKINPCKEYMVELKHYPPKSIKTGLFDGL